ncbi:CDGSH iron-sulfur domain-containing protein [Mycolicibacterium llatzerense]|uniref:CDGSH iron-sulfur domain-containing protein n=1 Tax=Mycolicibacterium llatzerense TaxID=280871 RepID=UPI0008DE6DFE|nr:CDGSH iron-sulfur domain-containing protein [Mycolicibacterium llatzerense]
MSDSTRRLVRVVPSGPILVEGPVRIELADGRIVESDRFIVGICTCRRSKIYPLCDTSHRTVVRNSSAQRSAPQDSVD